MEGLEPFVAAVGLILVLELGDKTQLATISLATRHPWAPVLAGAATGLILVTALGAGIGAVLAASLTEWLRWVKVAGGALFIAFGIASYLRKEGGEPEGKRDERGPFLTALALNGLAELGDKTQIAVIVLAATYAAPMSVFAGASLGLVAIATTSVLIGAGLARVLQARWLRIVSTVLFVAAGVFLIVEALAGG